MDVLSDWLVAYRLPGGETAPRPVQVPHAWRQDVDVRWEGPALYRTQARLPDSAWIVFEGVSYAARVLIDGVVAGEHRGIWDAFVVDACRWSGRTVSVEVEVLKNGGSTYPVCDVLSGFLPYVFHTFGGIYKPVRVVSSAEEPLLGPRSAAQCRIRADGSRLILDGKPWFVHGILSWGWYSELGHANPDEETIRREIQAALDLGFNLVKFCLWVPPHRYLELLAEAGLEAWIELPLWDPTPNPERLADMRLEIERIVRQYRGHPNVVLWTCGCELSEATPSAFRRDLVQLVRDLTGNPMVKDNSGGSEMYGGDPREYGGFLDFHPYCDLPFYPPVLDSLVNGPREPRPILLGEFNDVDTFRDLGRIARERPYWAASDPELNDMGVRWQHDLPRAVEESRFARMSDAEIARLRARSESKAHFIRTFVAGQVRQRADFAGSVVTGWIDTPISTAGYLDDWGQPKAGLAEPAPRAAFVLDRRPPWVAGGNRPGWQDPFCRWEGGNRYTIVHWEDGAAQTLAIERESQPGREELPDGLFAWVFSRPDWARFGEWAVHDPGGLLGGFRLGDGPHLLTTVWDGSIAQEWQRGRRVVLLLDREAVIPMPFWRECLHEVVESRNWLEPFVEDRWERMLALSTDRAIDRNALESLIGEPGRVLLNRIDTRTFAEHPYAMEFERGNARLVATTLRPYGGLGITPSGIRNNPSGAVLLASLLLELAGPDE